MSKIGKKIRTLIAALLVVSLSTNAFAYGTSGFSATCAPRKTMTLASRTKTDATSYAYASVNTFELVNPPSVYQILFALQLIPSTTGQVLYSREFYGTGSVTWGLDDPENAIGVTFTLKAHNNSPSSVSIRVAGSFGV